MTKIESTSTAMKAIVSIEAEQNKGLPPESERRNMNSSPSMLTSFVEFRRRERFRDDIDEDPNNEAFPLGVRCFFDDTSDFIFLSPRLWYDDIVWESRVIVRYSNQHSDQSRNVNEGTCTSFGTRTRNLSSYCEHGILVTFSSFRWFLDHRQSYIPLRQKNQSSRLIVRHDSAL